MFDIFKETFVTIQEFCYFICSRNIIREDYREKAKP